MEMQIQRQGDRRALQMDIKFLSLQKDRQRAEVSDLSEHGCRIDLSASRLLEGNRVMVQVAGFEKFYGTVKWVADRYAGIEFDNPLHPAIVDHICSQDRSKSAAAK